MQLKSGNFCPLIGKDCVQFECKFWHNIKGQNPNTGEDVDEWECTISMLPFLILEASQQSRQTAAAVESFRNVSVEQTHQMTHSQLLHYKLVTQTLHNLMF